MKRRRAEESADGLALMTSSVTSSYSADGLREQSQESTAIAKRCRLHKLIRQRFALALKDSADALCVDIQQSQDTSWKHMFKTSWTTRRKQQQHPVESLYEPAVAMNTVASFAYPVASSTQSSRKLWNPRHKKIRCSEALQPGAKAYILREAPLKSRLLVGENQSAVADVNRTVHQQRENEKNDEAIDRHWRGAFTRVDC
ncbi:hypothetical protein F511_04412 [Dorcoceras hygrometricum]|uniref:Uncharacterized protein n=1 Tax=Dorcoceras hygrometricum TaxID=472368 RepID=A0A2Z7D6R2_9LAMI|nr:hypothetical protein F511_04412 [Dorcoceras hygrometricum]